MHSPALIFKLWLGYVFFLIYGSLVPLDFQAMPLDQAWAQFQHTPMLKLGVESRADWIANGVLFLPAGFLSAHWLIETCPRTSRTLLYSLVGVLSAALALGLEFTQIFFPQRTVSLNDIVAEIIGALIGLLLAAKFSAWFKALLNALFVSPRQLAWRALEAYLLAYLAFSLFPYDILLSSLELQAKLQGESWGWLIAEHQHTLFLIGLKLLAETALTLPFGLFLGWRSIQRPPSFLRAIVLGLLLGGAIEIAQFFTASGVSQGLSILTRAIGTCAGLWLWQYRAHISPARLRAFIQRHILALGGVYLTLLLQTNGYFSLNWHGLELALRQWQTLHFLPFYYHYYTSESRALLSLASVALMYLPIGLLTWSCKGSPLRAFLHAMLAAALIETGKLFLHDMRPDPTNILIGALAAWLIMHLAQALSSAISADSVHGHPSPPRPLAPALTPQAADTARRWQAAIVLTPVLVMAAWWTAHFPTHATLLSLGLTATALVAWHRPAWLITLILAALPILDLAAWSGRFFLDAFDLLLFVGLSVGLIRTAPVAPHNKRPDLFFALASSLLLLSYAIGTLRGVLPWQAPDINAFNNYFSPFNALRIAKGMLWAYLSLHLLQRLAAAKIDIKWPLTRGMVSGLTLTVAVILWERITFASLLDFSSDYRVTGPFSSMHTGGAYIECFLVVATPFLLVLIMQTRHWISRGLGVLLLLASTYALMVTFSRTGYLAFGIMLIMVLFFAIIQSGRKRRRVIAVAGLAAAVLAVAVPVFNGQFVQSRLANTTQDYKVRQAHWQDTLNIRSPDWLTTLFGMGVGSYPRSHYLFSREENRSGTYQLQYADGIHFLHLGSGDPIYIEQIVAITPHQDYVLSLDARARQPDSAISVALCEKWLLTSFTCVETRLAADSGTAWHSLTATLSSLGLAEGPWYARKTVKFILHNAAATSAMDISQVRLENRQGENLLRNGDFSHALDHWYFSADHHLQWHAKNLPIATLFELGWLGLTAWGVLLMLAIKRALVQAWQGDLHFAAWLAALCGFLVVGLFDTLIDAPRFLFLLLLLASSSASRALSASKTACDTPDNSSAIDIAHRGAESPR